MIKLSQSVVLALFASVCALTYGQNMPAVTSGPGEYRGFRLPDAAGTFTYALSGTETARTGYYTTGGEVYSTIASGDIAFLSNSAIHPFKMVFSGGYSYITSGQPSSPFVNLDLNQSFGSRNWNLVLDDSIRYLPESPVSGLSGLPGLGDLGIPTTDTDGQDILSRYSQRVVNSTSGNLERKLTGSTSLLGSGTFSLQRFVGSGAGGYDYNQVSGQTGVKHRIDALSDAGVNYTFTRFSYIESQFSFVSQGVNFNYHKEWTRRLTTDVSLGPERHVSSDPTLGGPSLGLSANLDLNYLLERGSIETSYVRGVQSGSGVIQGAIADSFRVSYSHRLGEYGNLTLSTTYGDHRQIFSAVSYSTSEVIGAIQASRVIGPNFSVYAGYNAEQQTSQTAVSTINAFNGLSQTVSVGITYSPQPKHVGN